MLERQIARLLRADAGTLDSPGKIIRCMPLFAEHFRWGRQEDAHEFLRYVVDACHTAGLRMRKRLPVAITNGIRCEEEGRGLGVCMVMKETFGGALLSQVKCLVCKGESNKTDDIMDISLDLPGSSSVSDALARFFQPEILEGANKYSCERCKKLTSARKQMFILRAPKVLVIQLKRFEGINGGKINRNIEFKESLVLSDFMFKKNQDSQPVYNLFGCIIHSGLSPESGHYYAYVKDATSRWFCCNDSHVSLSSSQNVLSEKVYILFYILNSKPQKHSTNGYSSTAAKSCSTNGIGTSSIPPSETLKLPLVKQNGSCSSQGNALLPKNGKPASGPHIKPIHFKNSATEKAMPNGKANLTSKMNPGINDSPTPSESNGCKTGPFAEPCKKNANGTVSREEMDHSGRKLQDANENGHPIHNKSLGETSNGNATCAQQYPEQSSDAAASKSQLLHQEESSNSVKHVVTSANNIMCSKRHLEEDKFKEMLAVSADSELRMSVWIDDVYNFMRSQKRRRIESSSIPQDFDEMREQLKSDSARLFRSKVPEPLREGLIQRLKSYFERKYSPKA